MIKYQLYIHGVPIGHEICGGNTADENAYIEQFYDLKTKESTILKIDIVDSMSYYSYVKKNNFTNAEGRPGSYFGLTVCFPNFICTNVNILYKILDAIYKGVFEGAIIKNTGTGNTFLVRELAAIKYKGYSLIDYVRLILDKNIEDLLINDFEQIPGKITTRGLSQFNLGEVDSPIFRETLLTKQVIVSPEIELAINANHSMQVRIPILEEENKRLAKNVAIYQENESKFKKDFIRLEHELANVRESESVKLKEAKRQLQESEKQRTDFEIKNKELVDIIKSMDDSFKKASSILKDQTNQVTRNVQSPQKSQKKNPKVNYNNFILFSIFIFSIFILIILIYLSFLSSPKITTSSNQTGQDMDYRRYINIEGIDIKGYSGADGLNRNTIYKLDVKYGVDKGKWVIDPVDSGLSITDGSFKIDDKFTHSEIKIDYYINDDEPIVSRIFKVKSNE